MPPDQITNTPTQELTTHPDNPRHGDIGAITTSIEQNGWYGTLVAQRSTSRVLVGNHRLVAAIGLGLAEVPVYWVDCDDDEARRILVADNRTSDLAAYDEPGLASLLQAVMASTDGLVGTGYDGDDLDELLADIRCGDPIFSSDEGEPCTDCGWMRRRA